MNFSSFIFPPRTALRWLGMAVAAAALAACGGGGGGIDASTASGTSASSGMLRVAMTDAPSCGFDHVFITLQKVRVHLNADAGDADADWVDLTLSPPKRIDLLSLTNGALTELGTTTLPPGQYKQVRLVLAANDAGNPLANSVQPTGGAEVPLTTPSGQHDGVKLQAQVDVVAGKMADLMLDFDACRSIVKAGNSGKFILKPAVSVVPRMGAGIQGFVAASNGRTTISAQQNGLTVRSTRAEEDGRFNLSFLRAGTYTLVLTADGHATGVVTGVPVGTSTVSLNGSASAVALPTSTMADITGTVVLSSVSGSTTVSTPTEDEDARVRALQDLTGGPTIEVARREADDETGAYRLHLPVAAPVKASYVAGGTLTFAADAAAAGKYKIEASAEGRAAITKPATISAGTGATVNFSWGP